jgi:hypothetical protein
MVALAGSGLWSLLAFCGGIPAPLIEIGGPDPANAEWLGRPAPLLDGVLRSTEAGLPWVWAIASLSLLAAALWAERGLLSDCRDYRVTRIAGIRVWVSAVDGPATFGPLRPRIVIPYWMVSASPGERRLAVLHELNHVRAGDLQLLWASYLVVCAMPWNPAVWWLFRRLERAVEIDCDGRVLSVRGSARAYGELLVRAATIRSSRVLSAPGLLARPTLLKARIEHMRARAGGAGNVPWGLMSSAVVLTVAVIFLPAPAAPARLPSDTAPEHGEAVVVRRLPGGAYRASELSPAQRSVLETPTGEATFRQVDDAPPASPTSTEPAGGVIRATGRRR